MELQELVERIQQWKQRQASGDADADEMQEAGAYGYADQPVDSGEGDGSADSMSDEFDTVSADSLEHDTSVEVDAEGIEEDTMSGPAQSEEESTQTDDEESTAIEDRESSEISDDDLVSSVAEVSDDDIVSDAPVDEDETEENTEEFPIEEVIDMTEEK